jgi:hypothetical protein
MTAAAARAIRSKVFHDNSFTIARKTRQFRDVRFFYPFPSPFERPAVGWRKKNG